MQQIGATRPGPLGEFQRLISTGVVWCSKSEYPQFLFSFSIDRTFFQPLSFHVFPRNRTIFTRFLNVDDCAELEVEGDKEELEMPSTWSSELNYDFMDSDNESAHYGEDDHYHNYDEEEDEENSTFYYPGNGELSSPDEEEYDDERTDEMDQDEDESEEDTEKENCMSVVRSAKSSSSNKKAPRRKRKKAVVPKRCNKKVSLSPESSLGSEEVHSHSNRKGAYYCCVCGEPNPKVKRVGGLKSNDAYCKKKECWGQVPGLQLIGFKGQPLCQACLEDPDCPSITRATIPVTGETWKCAGHARGTGGRRKYIRRN